MSSIAIIINGLGVNGDRLQIASVTYVQSATSPVGSSVEVDFDASPHTINATVIQAGIDAAVAAGFTVGQHDSKILFGGA